MNEEQEPEVPPLTMDAGKAAARLGCGPEWLKQQARQGLVPHVLMGRQRRFTEEHLRAILAAREQVAADPWVRSARAQARRRRPA